jgi:hypothetical protein
VETGQWVPGPGNVPVWTANYAEGLFINTDGTAESINYDIDVYGSISGINDDVQFPLYLGTTMDTQH